MMEIIYNEAVDFAFSLYRLANRQQFRIRCSEMELKGLSEIERWVLKIEKELSPFLLSDIDLIIKQLPVTLWNLLYISQRPEPCSRAEELIDRLEQLTVDEYLKHVHRLTELPEGTKLTKEMIVLKRTETTSDSFANHDTEADMLLALFNNPESFLSRIKKTIHEYYDTVYVKTADDFKEILESKLKWHRAELKKGEKKYLEAITHQSISSIFNTDKDPDIFFSLFLDIDVTISISSLTMFIGAGTDAIIKSRTNRDTADILFNTLGDPKRLELLRLISHRRWYSSELAEHFGLTPATMSYHLGKLAAVGFAQLEKGDQKRFYYSLNKDIVRSYLNAAAADLLGEETDY